VKHKNTAASGQQGQPTASKYMHMHEGHRGNSGLSYLRPSTLQAALNRGVVALALGECNGNPLQYSCLENPMDRGAW